jgi:4-hydroxybenzoate polyprenyltransferase
MNIKTIAKLIRVPQWIKNLFVLVPLVFSMNILHADSLKFAAFAFFAFCSASSFVYIINDIVDREADRLHPKKKNRPIASGAISVWQAIAITGVLLAVNFALCSQLSTGFILTNFAYILLNILYTFYSKNVVLLDIFSIAAGFMLRVIAGAHAINVETSSWLLLTTMFLSLFLAVMKRRSELVLTADTTHSSTRKVLTNYTVGFTDQMATISAAAVIICYALYTTAQRTIDVFKTEELIYTTPFVVFGIFRYMYLVYKFDQGENTTEIMLHDVPMITNILLYISATLLILYKVIG